MPRHRLVRIAAAVAFIAAGWLGKGVACAEELGRPDVPLEYHPSLDQWLPLNTSTSSMETAAAGGFNGSPFTGSQPGEGLPAVSLPPGREEYLEKLPQGAFIRSFVLPGWGQYWGERPVRGGIFLSLEAALWTGTVLLYQTHLSQSEAYRAFAHQHAGISGEPGHQFYVDIGNYNSREEYNAAQRKNRRYEDQYTGDATWWSWDFPENRARFEDLRIRADRDKNRMYYLVGALAINRIVSAIDAARGLAGKQKKLREKYNLSAGYDPRTSAPTVEFSFRFSIR